MSDLAEFLLARTAEDKALAQAALDEAPTPWRDDAGTLQSADGTTLAGYAGEAASPHIARHDPARVLAECAAKRAIVEGFNDWHYHDGILELLALPYADHEDYDEAWRP